MRWLVLLLPACTLTSSPTPTPRVARGVQVAVRVPAARHAVKVDHHVFVWPSADPPADLAPTDEACLWWHGRLAGLDVARRGVADGSLGWGVIAVSPETLSLGGRDLLALQDGRVPAEARDASTILALSEALAEARPRLDRWYETCGQVYRDRPLLAVDADVPVETLSLVLGTLAVHRFDRAALLVGDRDPSEELSEAPADAVPVVLRQRDDQIDVLGPAGHRRASGPATEAEALIATALGGRAFGCTYVVPTAGTRVEPLVGTLDAAVAWGSRAQRITPLLDEADAPPPAPERPGRRPTEWVTVDTTGAVLWLDQPPIVSGGQAPLTCEDTDVVRLPDAVLAGLDTVEADERIVVDPVAAAPLLVDGLGRTPDDAPRVLAPTVQGPLDLGGPGAWAPQAEPLVEALGACVDEAVAREVAAGTLQLRFEVGPDGKPFDAQVLTHLADDPSATCVLSALAETGTLSAPDSQSVSTVRWPLRLPPPANPVP